MRYLIALLLMIGPAMAQNQVNNNVTAQPCRVVSGNPVNTITTGGAAQVMIPANSGVSGFFIMNIDTTEPLWISFTGTAVAGAADSYPLQAATASTFAGAGSFYSTVGFSGAISIVAATTGHRFSCTKW